MSISKRITLGGIEVRQDKRHLPPKFRPERVDDALELSTVRSARQEHLYDRRLFADNVEAAIPWLPGQRHHSHDAGDPQRSSDQQPYASSPAALPLYHGLLARRFPTLPHLLFSRVGASSATLRSQHRSALPTLIPLAILLYHNVISAHAARVGLTSGW